MNSQVSWEVGAMAPSNPCFQISGGRTLCLDRLTIETRCANWSAGAAENQDIPLLVKRNFKDFKVGYWCEPHEVYFDPEIDSWKSDNQSESVLVSALLFSAPISKAADFSELMVVFLSLESGNISIRDLLVSSLSNLDWDNLAIDRVGQISK